MEVELPNIHRATSSDCWSLASNQYPSGKFPKVSIGIMIPKTGSGSRIRDSAAITTSERKLSQGTDGRPRESKGDQAAEWVSLKPVNHDVSGTPEAVLGKRESVVKPDNNTPEQPGTFSFGTRREQVGHLDQVEGAALSTQERTMLDRDKCREEPSDKGKPNNEVLRMKLWEILGGSSQNKQTVTSPNPDDIKTPNQRNSQTANLTKSKPFSDPIETDSDRPNQAERRPVTRSLARKKAPSAAVRKPQGKTPSAKKPLSSFSSGPKQKPQNKIFVFDDERKGKSVGMAANDQSGSFKFQRSSNMKAKIEPQKINFSERISDNTTQDDGEEKLPSPKKASSKSKENVSFSSLSRTGKAPESYSNSFKRERSLNTMAKVEPQKMHFSEKLNSDKKMQDDGEEKHSSPKKTSSKSKENGSFSSLPRQGEKDPLQTPEASDRSLHSHRAAEKFFNSQPLSCAAGTRVYAASPSPEVQKYPWDAASPEINDLFGQKKVGSPLVDSFRNMPVDFPSPTFAMNVDTSLQRSKLLDDALYSPKYPKSLDRSRSRSYASDPDSESSDEMYKTNEVRGMKPPYSAEERENEKQPSLSAMEDEGTQSFVPNFSKGYRSGKWFSDFDSPEKCTFTLHSRREAHLKDDRMGKRNLSSPSPFAAARTEETNVSDKESEQCPENSLARAVRQLVVVLESFKTKIKSQTSKKSTEILAATVEKIHQHLEGAEFQMEADVDKLISAGKSKRKRLESTFQEQQEKLKTLHEKFREEVNQHLLDCRSSLEDFEAYHAELKGTADEQRASHRKLLLHVEEAIGAQLNDAETKIAEVQKGARKKMNGLKYVLKEFIAEAAD